jgi:hypothetical protein
MGNTSNASNTNNKQYVYFTPIMGLEQDLSKDFDLNKHSYVELIMWLKANFKQTDVLQEVINCLHYNKHKIVSKEFVYDKQKVSLVITHCNTALNYNTKLECPLIIKEN